MLHICVFHSKCNLYYNIIAEVMIVRKFKIPSVPMTTNKSIRFPNPVIEQVENAIRGTDCTFTAFVVEAVKLALESLEEDKK